MWLVFHPKTIENPVLDHTYVTVGTVEGVSVLQGIDGKHSLPEEAHSSQAYIQLDKNGDFRKYREYDKDHYLTLEIGCHREPALNKKGNRVLHIHTYDRNFIRSKARKLTENEYNKYKKYFVGVN